MPVDVKEDTDPAPSLPPPQSTIPDIVLESAAVHVDLAEGSPPAPQGPPEAP
jgi:hypothetical protein